MQFKALLTSFIASTVLSYVPLANAADVIRPTPIAKVVVAPAAPAFSWAGPYLGIETGVVITKLHSPLQDDSYLATLIKPKEQPSVGLFTGYNFALGHHAILGLDANIDYHSIESAKKDTVHLKYKEGALAAARVRLGFAQGRVLPYIAGGLSANRAALSLTNPTVINSDSNKQKTYIGWNIGGGIDFALAKNVFLRADYRFNRVKIKDIYSIDASNSLIQANPNIATKAHELRIGAAYKF
ncbi:outer membrane beta-barrel protein [Bartonella sp. TP]|uniref:outer membrane protein n=1 Tax=Bartonella sp. TP TaxID=3057550 RepID=UPI0025B11439|nr:outer membrane beta-barrel protein [Bartonella sp. TP]WJW80477.1 outer membrane beta-barrel protein [Bartonella sp. TP]